jgi:hypothetical protein
MPARPGLCQELSLHMRPAAGGPQVSGQLLSAVV